MPKNSSCLCLNQLLPVDLPANNFNLNMVAPHFVENDLVDPHEVLVIQLDPKIQQEQEFVPNNMFDHVIKLADGNELVQPTTHNPKYNTFVDQCFEIRDIEHEVQSIVNTVSTNALQHDDISGPSGNFVGPYLNVVALVDLP